MPRLLVGGGWLYMSGDKGVECTGRMGGGERLAPILNVRAGTVGACQVVAGTGGVVAREFWPCDGGAAATARSAGSHGLAAVAVVAPAVAGGGSRAVYESTDTPAAGGVMTRQLFLAHFFYWSARPFSN